LIRAKSKLLANSLGNRIEDAEGIKKITVSIKKERI